MLFIDIIGKSSSIEELSCFAFMSLINRQFVIFHAFELLTNWHVFVDVDKSSCFVLTSLTNHHPLLPENIVE